MYFDCLYTGSSASLLSIYYGTVSVPKKYTCSNVAIITASTTASQTGVLSCQSAVGSDGPYVFTVSALTQFDSAQGSDTFKYPTVPVVFSVTGCPVFSNLTNATSQCPTDGGAVTLTVTGDNFTPYSMACSIGSSSCSPVTYLTAQQFTCPLPVGVGVNAPVTVVAGSLFSLARSLVSYAAPSVSSVSGCTDVGSSTTNCPRAGGQRVTVIGTNFGASDAEVLVDGVRCTAVTHAPPPNNHINVSCSLPAGTALSSSLLLVQNNGQLSTTYGDLSYTQCTAGYYAPLNVVNCSVCALGTFSAVSGLYACAQCASGTFASVTGSTVCTQCPAGTFGVQSGGLGAQNCSNCSVGYYSNSIGQATCLPW